MNKNKKDYLHTGETFVHDGFEFKNFEYYEIDEIDGYVYLIDDNGWSHQLSKEEADEYL